MTAAVIFDSNFGNTKLVAETIADELGITALAVVDVDLATLLPIDVLVVGAPINGWRPSERMGQWLARLQPGQLRGTKVATFDTRVNVFFHGDAMKKIAAALEQAGATLIGQPHGFIVEGKTGPVKPGELVKAAQWAQEIARYCR